MKEERDSYSRESENKDYIEDLHVVETDSPIRNRRGPFNVYSQSLNPRDVYESLDEKLQMQINTELMLRKEYNQSFANTRSFVNFEPVEYEDNSLSPSPIKRNFQGSFRASILRQNRVNQVQDLEKIIENLQQELADL